MWFINIKRNFYLLFFIWIFAVLIQSLGRLYFILDNFTFEFFLNNKTDVYKLLNIGLIFDIRVASIALIFFLVISTISSFNEKVNKYWTNLQIYFLTFILFIICLITIVNFYYFKTYDRHIDVFIFGLLHDDTVAIIKTIWSDYPVIWCIFIMIFLTISINKIIKLIKNLINIKVMSFNSIKLSILFILITYSVTFIGMRGSISTFPLRQHDSQISKVSIINKFVPNGLIALEWAFKSYKLENQFITIDEVTSEKILSEFFNTKTDNNLSIFNKKTQSNSYVEQNKPNIVFSLMESMSTHLFQLDDKDERDLYGELRKHFFNDFVFKRFISEGNGTADSLNRLLVRSNMAYISKSSAYNKNFTSNLFKPYKDKGYKIIFIYAGNGGWQNINNFILNLGADEFIDQNTLIKTYPEAELFAWGVSDEYMFKYANKILETTNDPVFLMTLSMTNHSPYKLPINYKLQDFKINNEELIRFKNLNNGKINNVLNTFYYSNDQLGKFITNIKNSNNADKTIIAVTGDHNMRGIGYSDPQELALSYSVPFYLYIPENYKKNVFFDENKIGSHKDIMPTLYNLSLSNSNYYNTGCNLLSRNIDETWCNIGYNENIIISEYGTYQFNNNQFRLWQENKKSNLLLQNMTEPSEEQLSLNKRWKNYSQILTWQLMKQINYK